MKKVPVQDAVGNVLAHDLTKIEPGKSKGARFKKGHKITSEDVPELLKMGKENIYIYELEKGKVHEDDGAHKLARILARTNKDIELVGPSEGKISLKSKVDGLLKVDKSRLMSLNRWPEIVAVTCYNNMPVKENEIIAETRIVPLVIEEDKLKIIEREMLKSGDNVDDPIIELYRYNSLSASLIVTGSEVYNGRVEDGFSSVVERKVKKYGSFIKDKVYLPDDEDMIKKAIVEESTKNNMVIVTGGMSVDPDDVTPTAIRKTGAEIITYGAPLLPGTMLMLAYLEDTPIFGLPGCVMYARTTAFDVFLPRILAGERVVPEEISTLGHGGLCFRCEECNFPKCGFGQG